MPPALGSGLAAEKAMKSKGKEDEGARPKRKVGFEEDATRPKGRARVGESIREEKGEDDGDDDPDEYEEDEAEERIGRHKKGNAMFVNDEDDEDDEPGRPPDPEQNESGEESGEENLNEVGEVLEPFNLNAEREEGHFDENGNYVWRKNEDRPDEWLQSMGGEAGMEEAIGQAAAAQRKQRLEIAARHALEEAEAKEAAAAAGSGGGLGSSSNDPTALLRELVSLLAKPEETVVRALKRLAPAKRGFQPKGSSSSSSSGPGRKGGSGDATDQTPADEEQQRVSFARVTECADRLMGGGEVNIYHMSRDELEDKLDQLDDAAATMAEFASSATASALGLSMEAAAGGAATTSAGSADGGDATASSGYFSTESSGEAGSAGAGWTWEYRAPDGAVHGPFSTAHIMAWRAQGFFTGAQQVHMRPAQQGKATPSSSTAAAASAPAAGAAVDDFMADFEDDEGGDGAAAESEKGAKADAPVETAAQESDWVLSDQIDFSRFM
jgi:CD2 antigen cytoplasmic tail-binding protein 2